MRLPPRSREMFLQKEMFPERREMSIAPRNCGEGRITEKKANDNVKRRCWKLKG